MLPGSFKNWLSSSVYYLGGPNGVVDKHYTYGYYGCGFNSCVKLLFFLNACLIRQDLGSGWRGTWWILSLFDFISFQFRKYFLDFPKYKSGVLKRVTEGLLSGCFSKRIRKIRLEDPCVVT